MGAQGKLFCYSVLVVRFYKAGSFVVKTSDPELSFWYKIAEIFIS